MDDLSGLTWTIKSQLMALPGTLVWIAALVVGVAMVMRRHTVPGGLLIGASLLSGLSLVVDVMLQWMTWNPMLGSSSSTVLGVLGGVNLIISLAAPAMLLAAIWAGRKPEVMG
ncbi:MAG: hypothetical protein ACI8RZ_000993 [Myxococcota bacterium]|jgi:hypothetical protein